MSAIEALRKARENGVRLGVAGADLILDAEREPPAPVLEELRRHKAGIINLLMGKDSVSRFSLPAATPPRGNSNEAGWDATTAEIIDWFLRAEPPTQPFQLTDGVYVSHPARWWAYVTAEIAAGPDGSRARYGALQGDLRRLAGLFRPDIIEAVERAPIQAEGDV